MPQNERISRLDVEERRFSGTTVSVSTHTGTISVSGRLLDNFETDLAVDWVCHVLNGWDFRFDPATVRAEIAKQNRKNLK